MNTKLTDKLRELRGLMIVKGDVDLVDECIALSELSTEPQEATSRLTDGPYTVMRNCDYRKEAGFFGMVVVHNGVSVFRKNFNMYDATDIKDALNATYAAGQASRQAPEPVAVGQVMEVVRSEVDNARGAIKTGIHEDVAFGVAKMAIKSRLNTLINGKLPDPPTS